MKITYFLSVFFIFLNCPYVLAQVGINTTTPHQSSMLDITSTNKGFLMPRMTTTEKNAIVAPADGLTVYDTTTKSFWYWNGTIWTQYTSNNIYNTDGTLTGNRIVTQGANTLTFTGTGNTIFNSGNVGIGTTTPNAPLQFSNSVVNRKIVLYDTSNNDNQYYGFGINSGTLRYQIAPGARHAFFAGVNATTSNELMNINANGNIGIGTVAPTTQLHTTGGVRLQGLSGAGTRMVVADLNGVLSTQAVPAAPIAYLANNGLTMSGTTVQLGGALIQPTAVSGITATNTMRFLSANNPDAVITVGTNGGTSGGVYFGNTGHGVKRGFPTTGTDNNVGLYTTSGNVYLSGNGAATNQFVLTNAGNVGIAVNPTNKLDVALGARSGAHATNRPFYATGDVNSNSNGFEFRHSNATQGIGFGFNTIYAAGSNAAQELGFASKSTGNLNFYTNNSQRMTVSGVNGNVGIGTTAPVYRLDLAEGTFGFGNNNARTETRNNAGLQGNAGAQSGFFETDSPSNFPAGATSWWHLIDTRHNNPGNNYALQIAGSFFDQNLWFRKTNNNPTTPWTRILTSNTGWETVGNTGTNPNNNFIGTTDNQSFAVRTNNAERVRVTNAGNVGIGTNNPSQRLDVQGGNARINNTFIGDVGHGGGWAGFSHSQQNNTTGYALRQSNTGAITLINKEDTGNGYIGFRVGNNNHAVITNDGYMGVGTTTPEEQLHVWGNTRLDGATYQNGDLVLEAGGPTESGGIIRAYYDPLSATANSLEIIANRGGGVIRFFTNSTPTTEKMRIANNGRVGIGITNPSHILHINGQGRSTNSAWATTSDERLKENIVDYKLGLNELMKIRTVEYNYKPTVEGMPEDERARTRVGILAQEIEKILPRTISTIEENGLKDQRLFNADEVLFLLINATQEQQNQIEALKIKLEELTKIIEK